MLFCDSFDHYATADIAKKWTSVVSSTIGAFGRNSTNGIRIDRDDRGPIKNFPTGSKATVIAGVAFKTSALSAATPIIILTDAGAEQIRLTLDASGHLRVSRGGTALVTGTTVLSINTSYFVELKATIHNTTGVVEVHLNGATEIASTGSLNTRSTSNNSCDGVGLRVLGGASGSGNYDFDDFYVNDTAGSVNNDFLGDVRVQALLPSGAGGHTQWTPSTGSNYQNVDESTPNDDTDYNSDSTTGDRDTYAYGDLASSTGNVKAVQIMTYARKDDAGTRQIAPVVRISSTDYDQATLADLSTTYRYDATLLETSPATSSAWTVSEINGAEFGVKQVT